jgi:eukaryotic-like serine/threonine-protein kinase
LGSEGSDSIGDPWVGTTVGKYLIEAVIASGGMGTVYKAKQTLPVQRSVALKMIRIGMADLSMIERFHRERQTLALMDHPDIARVYEAGFHGER